MSDESTAEIEAERRDFRTQHLAMYLGSGGAEGHIVDVSALGAYKFTTNLLLKYIGRKSGRTLITPLIYGDTGGEVVIVASKGGADHHPAWYLNVRECKELSFQVATQAFRATWREPQADERSKGWDFMVGVYPPYREYQALTERQIPLVMMSAIEPVETFKQ